MKYLITGSEGQLGKTFCQYMEQNNIDYKGLTYTDLDITNQQKMEEILTIEKPDIFINCAAYNLVDKAEKEETFQAYNSNTVGPKLISELCKKHNIRLVHFGTNYVFDGEKDGFYNEEDIPNPISEYAKSKYFGEKCITETLDKYLILRLSWLYGPGEQNFINKLQQWSQGKDSLNVTSDEVATPTSTNLVVNVTMQAIEKDLNGLYHIANSGKASRNEWAKEVFRILDKNIEIKDVPIETFNLPAKRPRNASLSNEKISKELGIRIPDWKEELNKYIKLNGVLN